MHAVGSNATSGLFIGTLFVGGIARNEWHTTLKVNERDIYFKRDTGADANVLPLDVIDWCCQTCLLSCSHASVVLQMCTLSG